MKYGGPLQQPIHALALAEALAQFARSCIPRPRLRRSPAVGDAEYLQKLDTQFQFELRAFPGVRHLTEQLERIPEMCERRIVGALLTRPPRSRTQVSYRLGRFRCRARLPHVIGEVVDSGVGRLRVQALDRIGDPQMEALAARDQEIGEDRLPNKIVRKLKTRLRIFEGRRYETQFFRLFHEIEQLIGVDFSSGFEQIKSERATNGRRGIQHLSRFNAKAGQASIDNHPNIAGNVESLELHASLKLSVGVEKVASLCEMAEQLFDKKRISFTARIKQISDFAGRLSSA